MLDVFISQESRKTRTHHNRAYRSYESPQFSDAHFKAKLGDFESDQQAPAASVETRLSDRSDDDQVLSKLNDVQFVWRVLL